MSAAMPRVSPLKLASTGLYLAAWPALQLWLECRQRVVTSGVYGVVRHPLNLGASLMLVGGPLLLGSAAALGVGLGLVLLLAGRIGAEERLLGRELEGYEAYRTEVRYRLVPGIW